MSATEACVAHVGARRPPWQHDRVERLARIGHWYWPADAETVSWSQEAARLHGRESAREGALLESLIADFSAEDGARLLKSLDAALETGARFDFAAHLTLPCGTRRAIRVTGEGDRDPAGQPLGVLVVVQEIPAARTVGKRASGAREADFEELFAHWHWETGPDLRITYSSPGAQAVLGVNAESLVGRPCVELLGEGVAPAEAAEHRSAIERREPFELGAWRTGPDGRRRYLSTKASPFFDRGGRFLGLRGIGRELTAEQRVREGLLETNLQLQVANARVEDALADLRRINAILAEKNCEMARAQAGIRYAAMHDTLTGLPNRRYLEEKLAACVAASRRDGTLLAALHIDLDRFKQINETLGHGAGDTVLRHIAGVLLHSVTAADFVARVGSDEFVLLCVDGEPGAIETLARRLIAELERPLVVEGRECWFGASIGIATTRGGQAAADALLVNADIALHRAKKQGRGCHAFFDAEMQREIVRYQATADGVLAGLTRAEFVPYYQPQISSDGSEIVGVEALARWNHPVDGVLPPARFLQVADDLGVAAALDLAILEQAVADLRRWQAAGLAVPKLSVNVSSRRLLDHDLIRTVSALELPPGVLSFELLESVFLDEIDDTISWNIDMLKEIGIEIELDDFGSGHASIIGLVKLGPNAIKIDRELVTSITADPARSALVQSIVDICRSLRTRVIAEGVETGAQADLLHRLGCDALQGYHFAAPMPAGDFEQFVERWQGRLKEAVGQGG